MHLVVDAFGMPVDLTVTSGTVADSSRADKLISEIEGQYLLADRAYYVLDLVAYKGMEAVIPSKRNRKKKRENNQEVYENRYQVEKTFLKLEAVFIRKNVSIIGIYEIFSRYIPIFRVIFHNPY